MSSNKFMKDWIVTLSDFFKPLNEIQTHIDLSIFLAKFGWKADTDSNILNIFLSPFNTNLQKLPNLLDEVINNDDLESLGEIAEIVIDLFSCLKDFSTIKSQLNTYPFDQQSFWNTFPNELLDYLTFRFFQQKLPHAFGFMKLLGVFSIDEIVNDSDRFTYLKRSTHFDRLGLLFSDFDKLKRELYNWNDPNFNYIALIRNLSDLTCQSNIGQPSENLLDKFYDINSPYRNQIPEARTNIINQIIIDESSTNLITFDLIALPIPPSNDMLGKPIGFMLGFGAEGLAKANINLTEDLVLSFEIGAESEAAIRIEIRPNDVDLKADIGVTDISTSISLIYKKQNPTILFGAKDSTRLEIQEVGATFKAHGNIAKPNINAEFEVKGGKLVIQGGDGDGFINKVLPKNPITIPFDFILGYAKNKGFYIDGGAGLEFTFMINKSLGPIFIDSIDLGLGFFDKDLSLITTITGGVEIGPVSATIGKIGLKTIIELGKPGILGKADLALDFKPPSLIALGIDASAVKGWGFLEIDSPNYAGGLGLTIVDKISVAAFVLLTTRLPDNMPGFSLLMSLMAEFSPAIQLSFGFALKGVGGIIGIHRTMSEDALREVVKNHSLDAILFPKNPAKDAAKIITALRSVFPPCDNHFVFGPMVKIIWGGPKDILEFSGGIFIEFGGPIRIAILGLAHAALPDEKASVVVLNIDVLGFIDFGKKTLAIDASIFDSSILKKFNLSGDFALRSNWGENPDFAMSLGGFHPRFNPPPGFPDLKRLTISIGKKNPRLALTCYLAITTNSFQTGAALDLYFKVASFVLTAGFSFDTLIIFKPFFFDVDIKAWAAIKKSGKTLLGIDLGFNLTGPNPYHAKGYGKFKILFIKVKVKFDKKFGKKIKEDFPTVHPAPRLVEQLESAKPIFEIPTWARDGVILAKGAEDTLSPIGNLVFMQNLVPVDFKMEVFGGGKPPADERKLKIDVIGASTTTPPKTDFAPNDYLDLSLDEKLSAPPFEKYNAGVRLFGEGKIPLMETWKSRPSLYETILVEKPTDENITNMKDFSIGDSIEFKKIIGIDKFSSASIVEKLPFAKQVWSLQGSKKHFKHSKKQPNKSNPNFITVNDSQFTVSTQQADGDQFKRHSDFDSNMTYHEALNLAKDIDDSEVAIRNSIYVEENSGG